MAVTRLRRLLSWYKYTSHHYIVTLWVRIPHMLGVLDTTLCDEVCQLLTTCWWFSPGTPVSSTNKSDCHNINGILLKVALSTINQPIQHISIVMLHIQRISNSKSKNGSESVQDGFYRLYLKYCWKWR